MYGPDGPLAKETAATLSSSLAAAQAAFRTPHPAPGPNVSVADALFASESPLTAAGVDGQLAKSFARSLEVPFGTKLENVSLRWNGWEGTHNFSGSDALPVGGYQDIVGKVLADAEAAGAQVRLSEPATQVADGDKDVTVTTASGAKYSARAVVCTIPLGVLQSLPETFFNPPLDARLADVVKNTNVGVLEKIVLNYDTAWWPQANELGSYLFLPTKSEADLTPASSLADVFASSTFNSNNFAAGNLPVTSPTLVTYITDTVARIIVTRPADQVAAAFHAFLESRFGTKGPQPAGFAVTSWLTDPHARGATTTPVVVSANGERSPMDYKELSRPQWAGRLGFAGEHTEMENRGSVAGAVLSGQREGERVERLLKKLGA